MNPELLAFGVLALGLGIAALIGGRRLYPRLEIPGDAEASLQLLTAMLAGVLLLSGLILVLLALFA